MKIFWMRINKAKLGIDLKFLQGFDTCGMIGWT